jgi:hypothetical protein
MRLKLLLTLALFSLFSTSFASVNEELLRQQVAKQVAPLTNIIVKEPIILTMPEEFEDSNSITDIVNKLSLYHDEQIIIIDEGFGGDLFVVRDLGRAILQAERNGNDVTMRIVGLAASGNAYIACYANHIVMDNGGSLLFHDAGGEASLFLGFLTYRETARGISVLANMVDDSLDLCKKANVLNDKDIEVIKSGDDVIFLMERGQLIRQYEVDNAALSSGGVVHLLVTLSNVLAVLGLLFAWLYIWRRAGK